MSKQTKISKYEAAVKAGLRKIRVEKKHLMKQAAKELGITVKKLEDIETVRDYGCHITIDILSSYMKVYGSGMVSCSIMEAHQELYKCNLSK